MRQILKLFAQPAEDRRQARQAAHRLLERAFREETGEAMPEIVRDRNGKPAWRQSGLFFSLSHTRTLAVCALADGPVGIDCETVRPVRARLAERILGPEERIWLTEQPETAFFRLWTAREAYGKYTGEGLLAGLKAGPWQPEPLCLPERPELAFGTVLTEQWAATWCMAEPCRDTPIFWREPEAI